MSNIVLSAIGINRITWNLLDFFINLVYAQRFEILAVDLFGSLLGTGSGNGWIFVIEDIYSKWVELFTLEDATTTNCAKILIEEIF